VTLPAKAQEFKAKEKMAINAKHFFKGHLLGNVSREGLREGVSFGG
jgi:hypothetical protein